MVKAALVIALFAVAGCGDKHHGLPDAPGAATADALGDATTATDATTTGVDASASVDAAAGADAGSTPDGAVIADAAATADAAHDAGGSTTITGGPCLSGAAGATAYRIRWAQAGSGVQAIYEVDGLPDHSRDHAAVYGYQIGFTASFADPFLGPGGVALDDSDFMDLEITTVGVPTIAKATLAIYGRSYNTTASGSFNWQTFDGTGSTPTNSVANSVPYQWYAADISTEIHAGDSGVLIRVKAGPGSDSLVVNLIELCIVD